jgi:hypothetical protein
MMQMLMDVPWWLPTILIVVGGYLAYDGNRRQDAKLRNVGLVVVLIAAGLTLVSYLADTPTEVVGKRTHQLVDAVENRDWPAFTKLLDAQVNLGPYQGRDMLVAGAKASVDAAGLKWANVLSMNVEPRGPKSFTVRMNCLSDQQRTARPVPSDWELTWIQTPEGWVVSEIKPLGSGAGASPEAIQREMVRAR